MFEYKDIYNDLKSLGINEGDTLFLRISYKSIGEINGGPKVFLDALLDVIGDEGTIILTAFPKKHISQLRLLYRRKVYSTFNRPLPTTGAMAKAAFQFPNAKISEKIDFPFVVIGKHSDYLCKNHTFEKEGYWLLYEAANKFNCKCLRIGGEIFIGTTHISFNNVLRANNQYQRKLKYGLYSKINNKVKWRETSNAVFCSNGFKKHIKKILNEVMNVEGKVGNGYAIITDMKKSIELETKSLNEDINSILCDNDNCVICRTSFSFSNNNKLDFLLKQIKRIFSKEYKNAILNIYSLISNIILGKNVN